VRPRVVIDSNVYVSALVFGGRPRKAIEHLERNRFDRLLSTSLIAEVEGVLHKKFEWDRSAIRRFCRPLWDTSLHLEPTTIVTACRDPKDNYLLSLAIDGKARLLVSGDRDLVDLGTFRGIPIVTPVELLRAGQ
jgi:putative PIN family toxin of toxin-antitoxin system